MATKYFHDTAPAKAVSAWVILKGGHHIATVQAAFGSGGRVLVNARNLGDFVQARTAKTLRKLNPKLAGSDYDLAGFQWGEASGYGYDKLTAALRGLVIDGHKLTDHCSREGAPKKPKGKMLYPVDFKTPKGYSLANYTNTDKTFSDGTRLHPNLPPGEVGYSDCYRESGLKFLEKIGYQVIQAV